MMRSGSVFLLVSSLACRGKADSSTDSGADLPRTSATPTAGGSTGSTTETRDVDGDGYSAAEGDCDDSDPMVHPGADEWLLGTDTNCDGAGGGSLSLAEFRFQADKKTLDRAGRSGSSGDFDGDGLSDILLSDDYNDDGGKNAGKTYVFLGSGLSDSATIDFEDADYGIEGADRSYYTGRHVSSAGDIDGDGLDDILIGAPSIYGSDDFPVGGEVYVVLGSSLSKSPTLSLADAYHTFVETDSFSSFGFRVSSAGDIDGDGLDDILFSDHSNSDGGTVAGKVYLVLSDSLGDASTTDVADADYSFEGENTGDLAGDGLSDARDVDGDGLGDILIGAHDNDHGGEDAGKVYLALGSSLDSSREIHLADADYSFVGENIDDHAGYSVSSGDFDGDGLGDILIGAYGNDDGGEDAGKTYVFLGSGLSDSATIDLAGADYALVGVSAGDYSGSSVSSAGDVDGDGLSDLLTGAHNGAGYAGETYLVLSGSLGGSATIDLIDADYSFAGEKAGDHTGYSVSSAGDVDGNGRDDILIGVDVVSDLRGGRAYLVLSHL